MGVLYSKAKHMYYKMSAVPILGSFCKMISPVVQRVLRNSQSTRLTRRDVAHQLELLAQAVVVLQRGMSDEVRRAVHVGEDVRTIKARLELVRTELFEEIRCLRPTPDSAQDKPEGRVLNQKKFGDAIAKGDIRFNVGCGHKPLTSYINVDMRTLPGVDVVADIRDLPVLNESVSEIYAAHLLEHFTVLDLKRNILPYWYEILAQNGVLRLVVPDILSMFQAYNAAEISFDDLREVTFGAQDYSNDFHYAMFSESDLVKMLRELGFGYVETIVTNRVNGKCREMEVVARK